MEEVRLYEIKESNQIIGYRNTNKKGVYITDDRYPELKWECVYYPNKNLWYKNCMYEGKLVFRYVYDSNGELEYCLMKDPLKLMKVLGLPIIEKGEVK